MFKPASRRVDVRFTSWGKGFFSEIDFKVSVNHKLHVIFKSVQIVHLFQSPQTLLKYAVSHHNELSRFMDGCGDSHKASKSSLLMGKMRIVTLQNTAKETGPQQSLSTFKRQLNSSLEETGVEIRKKTQPQAQFSSCAFIEVHKSFLFRCYSWTWLTNC